MKVTEVRISVIKPKDSLVAIASVVLDECLYLGSIGVHGKLGGEGYRITYPTRKVGDENLQTYHPLNKALGFAIEMAVLEKFKSVMNGVNYVRHDNPEPGLQPV